MNKIHLKCWQNISLCILFRPQCVNSSDAGKGIFQLCRVNTMPINALAPKVTIASAGMVLTVLHRQHVLLFQSWFHLLGWSQVPNRIQNVNTISVIFKFSMLRVNIPWWASTGSHFINFFHHNFYSTIFACSFSNSNWSIDASHKSHNALNKYPTMHRFLTEMCTCISVTKLCIVGYGIGALRDLCNRSICTWKDCYILSWHT